jgi:predicted DNA-binding protein (MmcQ/YjbR family)
MGGVTGAQQVITQAVSAWEGVAQSPHRFGATAFYVGRIEVGHVHGDALVDIPFTRSVRDALVDAGDAEPHHFLPSSGWVSVVLHGPDDVDRAIRLLRRAYETAKARG